MNNDKGQFDPVLNSEYIAKNSTNQFCTVCRIYTQHFDFVLAKSPRLTNVEPSPFSSVQVDVNSRALRLRVHGQPYASVKRCSKCENDWIYNSHGQTFKEGKTIKQSRKLPLSLPSQSGSTALRPACPNYLSDEVKSLYEEAASIKTVRGAAVMLRVAFDRLAHETLGEKENGRRLSKLMDKIEEIDDVDEYTVAAMRKIVDAGDGVAHTVERLGVELDEKSIEVLFRLFVTLAFALKGYKAQMKELTDELNP